MLVSMKEKGEDWNAIREAWKEATGQETANRSFNPWLESAVLENVLIIAPALYRIDTHVSASIWRI